MRPPTRATRGRLGNPVAMRNRRDVEPRWNARESVSFSKYGDLRQDEAGAWDHHADVPQRLPPDELRGLGTIHGLSLRDGDVWAAERSPGVWMVMWYPHRSDHPDSPSLTVDSETTEIPTAGGPNDVLAWASVHFAGRDEREFAEVSLDANATEEEVRAVERAFDEAGFPVIVDAGLEFRSRYPDVIPWTVVLIAPLGVFLSAIAKRAADDTYDALKRWLVQLVEARREGRGQITIDEPDRDIVLTTETPDEALRQLAAGEIPESGYVVWDDDERVWRRH